MKQFVVSLALLAAVLVGCSDGIVSSDPAALGAGKVIGDDGGRGFTVLMNGENEAPGPGDPDGSGTAHFTLNQGEAMVCWDVSVENIATPTAAHIHRAPAGTAGPVVLPLPPSGMSWSGCVTVDPDLVKEIRKSPEAFYVNVHNAEFPAGAVRGQLSE